VSIFGDKNENFFAGFNFFLYVIYSHLWLEYCQKSVCLKKCIIKFRRFMLYIRDKQDYDSQETRRNKQHFYLILWTENWEEEKKIVPHFAVLHRSSVSQMCESKKLIMFACFNNCIEWNIAKALCVCCQRHIYEILMSQLNNPINKLSQRVIRAREERKSAFRGQKVNGIDCVIHRRALNVSTNIHFSV
jgi:hypothetical protein